MLPQGVPNSIFARLNSGLRQVRNRDYRLLKDRVHEQTLTGRLSYYLQHEFPDHNVDAEYNKHYEDEKRYGYFEEDDVARPDIIVHQRGSDDRNLLVIEVKKRSEGSSDDAKDILKLEGLTRRATADHHYFGYKYGVFIDFVNADNVALRWVIGGSELARRTHLAAELDHGGFHEYLILES